MPSPTPGSIMYRHNCSIQLAPCLPPRTPQWITSHPRPASYLLIFREVQFQRVLKLLPTYGLIQKVWNISTNVTGYTKYGPILHTDNYTELAKLEYDAQRKVYGIRNMSQIFKDGVLLPFASLQAMYSLPSHMHFYCIQLKHAVKAHGGMHVWHLSPTSINN